MPEGLNRAGYPAAEAHVIVVGGQPDADSAMDRLKEHNCSVLLSRVLTDIGIFQVAGTWRIVLAQPLLSPNLGDWSEAGKEILELVNAARAQPRRCGNKRFEPAGPLQWNEKLAAAALAHSRDMAQRNYFAHEGRDGSEVRHRAVRHGYEWRNIGENIATGQGSAKQVVSGWLVSPQHCANIMEGAFTQMGAAYAVNLDSETTIYWTQVFGSPKR